MFKRIVRMWKNRKWWKKSFLTTNFRFRWPLKNWDDFLKVVRIGWKWSQMEDMGSNKPNMIFFLPKTSTSGVTWGYILKVWLVYSNIRKLPWFSCQHCKIKGSNVPKLPWCVFHMCFLKNNTLLEYLYRYSSEQRAQKRYWSFINRRLSRTNAMFLGPAVKQLMLKYRKFGLVSLLDVFPQTTNQPPVIYPIFKWAGGL